MRKTFLLMVLLVLIFMYFGNLIGGTQGMFNAFAGACGINLFSYFFSDSLVLMHYRAKEATEKTEPVMYDIIKRLSSEAGLPMPKIYVVPDKVPNAFATGRDAKHSAVAATSGLLELMSREELEGVLAHEMSHVRHHDILISTIAAIFAGAIAMLGNFARVNSSAKNQNRNALIMLLGAVLMPIAASIIQMSISRTREYKADEGAARLTKHPEWLMSALYKLENYANNYRMQKADVQTAHMFIVNPFSGIKSNFSSLFATHPSTANRIKRLAEIKEEMQL
ncbi:MAG: zinc metalloprotease HtpX [Alphaproteobacteria bacterium]|nr:zinc metalloprotease HtpX [Alphaproteobacteria bacterium]